MARSSAKCTFSEAWFAEKTLFLRQVQADVALSWYKAESLLGMLKVDRNKLSTRVPVGLEIAHPWKKKDSENGRNLVYPLFIEEMMFDIQISVMDRLSD